MSSELAAISLIIALTGFSIRAQQPDMPSVLQERLADYQTSHPSSNLYLHLDKTTYTPEETVWFKAYLLGDTSLKAKVLYVRIVDEEKTVVSEAQFPMYDVRAHGSIELHTPGSSRLMGFGGGYIAPPKIVLEGYYMLYAYTDRMVAVGDTNVFVQPFRITRMTGRRLEATASVTDTAMLYVGGQVQIKVDVTENGSFAGGVKGEYQLLAGGKELKYGRLTTNTFGEAFVNFTYPDLPGHEWVKVKLLFTQGNDHAELSLNLPHRGNPVTVECFPEGGNPVPGGRVAIEALDILGNPVRTALQVMDGDSTVAGITTDTLGMATVELPQVAGVRYTVKTLDGRGETTLDVPSADRHGGFSLKLHRDSAGSNAMVRNHGRDSTALLVLRTHREILWSAEQRILPGDSVMVVVPAGKYPKDVLSLAVLGRDGTTQAERLFLNRDEDDYRVSISTEQHDHGARKKVTVTLRAADSRGKPVRANLSVAAVLKSGPGSPPAADILRQWHLGGLDLGRARTESVRLETGTLNSLLAGSHWHQPPGGDTSLLAIGNRPDGMFGAGGVTGIIRSVDFPKLIFYPVPAKRRVKEVVIRAFENLSVTGSKLTPSFQTMAFAVDQRDNSFFIPDSLLVSRKGREWSLRIPAKVNNPFHYLYMIDWQSPDKRFDSLVVGGGRLRVAERTGTLADTGKGVQAPFDFQGMNLLDEVVIGAQDRVRKRTLRRTNCQCYDDIIMEDVMAFAPKRVPQEALPLRKDMTYSWGYTLDHEPRLVIYLGCGRYRDINYIKNITIPEEFPLPDYETYPTTELDMRSTVYWNPNIYTDADGTATFSFFTSDVTGEFEIVAQGLVESDLRPLMGTGSFNVTNR